MVSLLKNKIIPSPKTNRPVAVTTLPGSRTGLLQFTWSFFQLGKTLVALTIRHPPGQIRHAAAVAPEAAVRWPAVAAVQKKSPLKEFSRLFTGELLVQFQ